MRCALLLLTLFPSGPTVAQEFQPSGELGSQIVAPDGGGGELKVMRTAFLGEYTADGFPDVVVDAGGELRLLSNPGIWGSVRTLTKDVLLTGPIHSGSSQDAFFTVDDEGLNVWQSSAVPGEFVTWNLAGPGFDADKVAFDSRPQGTEVTGIAWFEAAGVLMRFSVPSSLGPGDTITLLQFTEADLGAVHDLILRDLDGDQVAEVVATTSSGVSVFTGDLQLIGHHPRVSSWGRLVPLGRDGSPNTRVAWLSAGTDSQYLSLFDIDGMLSEAPTAEGFAGFASGRILGDGRDDLFLSPAGGVLVVYQGCGGSHLPLNFKPCGQWIPSALDGQSSAGPIVADLDRDGDDDVIALHDDSGRMVLHKQIGLPNAEAAEPLSIRWREGLEPQILFEVGVGEAASASALVWAWSDMAPPLLMNEVVGSDEAVAQHGLAVLEIDIDPALETAYLGLELRLRAADGSPLRGAAFGLAKQESHYEQLEQLVPVTFQADGIPPQPNQGGELVGGVLPLPRLPPFGEGVTPAPPAGWN